jgi:hypothetical protein
MLLLSAVYLPNISVTHTGPIQRRMTARQRVINWNGRGRQQSTQNLKLYFIIRIEGLRTAQKSAKIFRIPCGIWSKHLLNMRHKDYRYQEICDVCNSQIIRRDTSYEKAREIRHHSRKRSVKQEIGKPVDMKQRTEDTAILRCCFQLSS